MLLRRAALLALVAGCGDDAAPDGGLCIVGDPTQPAELQVVARGLAPVADGDTLLLETPPQGGHVIFAGVRVKNADLCGASLQAAVRDPCTNRVLGIERRPIAWRIAEDGFAEPAQPQEISDYANVPLCPNAAAADDLDGPALQLELRFYPSGADPVDLTMAITATCADNDAPNLCRCECDSDYELGVQCPADADGGVAECVDAGL